jgi:histone H3/H4
MEDDMLDGVEPDFDKDTYFSEGKIKDLGKEIFTSSTQIGSDSVVEMDGFLQMVCQEVFAEAEVITHEDGRKRIVYDDLVAAENEFVEHLLE